MDKQKLFQQKNRTNTDASFGEGYFHGEGNVYPKGGYQLTEHIGRENAKRKVNYVIDHKSSNTSWLDVGCAYGFQVIEAYNKGIDVYGVDISHYAVSEGQRIYPQIKDRLYVCPCDELMSKFKPGSFDVVTMFEVVEHLNDPGECLSNAASLLAPNGFLLLTTPVPGSSSSEMDATHVNVHEIDYWRGLLTDLGLRVTTPELFYDSRLEGHWLVRQLTRVKVVRRLYMRVRALFFNYPSYYILACKGRANNRSINKRIT
ncbi:MAG TPA: class I SAM-dependent methyltransferase [Candidatus Binatia bacterium]|nr:class I SAM-dependent methyltransferase [Candidatus Binatia bacterium]